MIVCTKLYEIRINSFWTAYLCSIKRFLYCRIPCHSTTIPSHTMPPSLLPFENYKSFIYQHYIIQDLSVKKVLNRLEAESLKSSRSTLIKRIAEWKFQKNTRFQDQHSISTLRVKIAYLTITRALSDKKIHRV